MGRVVVVGGVNADVVVGLDRRPGGGETVVGRGPDVSNGGKGANQAAAAARAGADVELVAVVGDDAWGTDQLDALERSGVSTRHVRRSADASTGVALITVTPDGENAIAVGAGANAELRPADVDAVEAADVVVAQSEPGPSAVDAAAVRARATGARFVLNAAPVLAQDPATLEACDPLVVNEHEALDLLRLSGVPDSPPSAGDVAALLRSTTGARSVVVTLGREGALVVDDQGTAVVPAVPVEAVDTTGAGDVLVGSLAAGLAQGLPLVEAVRRACADASRSTTWRGAREPVR